VKLEQMTLPEAEALQAIRAGYVSVDGAGDWVMPQRVSSHAVAAVRARGFLVVPAAGVVTLTNTGQAAASPSMRRIVREHSHDVAERIGENVAEARQDDAERYGAPLVEDER
jgi:hypothetical protein